MLFNLLLYGFLHGLSAKFLGQKFFHLFGDLIFLTYLGLYLLLVLNVPIKQHFKFLLYFLIILGDVIPLDEFLVSIDHSHDFCFFLILWDYFRAEENNLSVERH